MRAMIKQAIDQVIAPRLPVLTHEEMLAVLVALGEIPIVLVVDCEGTGKAIERGKTGIERMLQEETNECVGTLRGV